MSKYLTMPEQDRTTMPGGVPYIVGNEAAERFSFYGMKSILVIFATTYLLNSAGQTDFLNEPEARGLMAYFTAAAYVCPLIGAIIADAFLGKYLTIMILSSVYVIGHAFLALMDMPSAMLEATMEPRGWLFAGLALVAIGSGGIKPCVSAHVGDQFGRGNQQLLNRVFGWFYFSINFGSLLATALTPVLLSKYGPGWAFGVPGVLMFIATVVFWTGRGKFVHIQPRGLSFFKETFTGEGLRVILKLVPVYLFIAVFWSLYDQTGGAWVLQATKMDRSIFGYELLPSQIQAINPLLILLFIPISTYVAYPLISRFFPLTPIRKISIGFFVTVAAFGLSGLIESWIDNGLTPNVGWQLLAYVIITAAEVMVSITGLEFSYRQAPPQMKSFVMSLFLLTVALGNVFTGQVNSIIQIPEQADAVVSPEVESRLRAAAKEIERQWRESGEDRLLPNLTQGQELVDGVGSGIRYTIIDGSTFQVTTEGEDGEYYTDDDVHHRSVAPPRAMSPDEIDAELARPLTWREKNVPGAERPSREVLEENARLGMAAPFESSLVIGGGSTLPGASYYWFFTWIMLGAAIVFVGVAKFYKPRDYIQGDDLEELGDTQRAEVVVGETDDR
ncbi:MAG: MFS transporter [Phycisphaerae bacterium]|nr:MFS transporter [Phycisphaerae bacterium]